MIKLIKNLSCKRYYYKSTKELINVAKQFTTVNNSNCEKQHGTLTQIWNMLKNDSFLYVNFITETEEDELMKDIDKSFRRTKYEYDHWDGAIHGFRETEKSSWSEKNQIVIDSIRSVCFEEKAVMIPTAHVLDLAKDGHIRPHKDSIKFCGSTIAGLSLQSPAVMRFTHTNDPLIMIDILLPQTSLYIMRNSLRYDFTHEILPQEQSFWNNEFVARDRRISVLLRNEP